MSATASRLSWPGPGFLVCLALGIVAYRPLLPPPKFAALDSALVFWLFEPSYTWAPPVIAGSLFLLYRRRERWRRLPVRRGPAIVVAALLGLGAGLFVWAWLTAARDLLVPSLMANALGVACLAKGTRGARVVLLPVLFLLFAWPLPPPLLNEAVWQLQLWTAAAAGWFLQSVGLPALIETTLVSRPHYAFAFVENCSGFRMMELLTAVAVIVREFTPGTGARSWLVVLAAPPIALVLNALRVFVVVASPDPVVLQDHVLQGIPVFVVGVLVLVLVARLARGSAPAAAPRARPGAPATAAWRVGTAALLAFSLLSLFPSPWLSAAAAPASPRAQIPAEQAGWVGEPRSADVLFLGSVRLPGSVSRLYSRGDETVTLFAATAAGADRTTSPFSPKIILPGMRWRLERSDLARLDALGVLVETAVVVRDGKRWLVYHWRRGDAGLVTETLRHALALDETPQGGRRQRDILRLATPVGTGSSAELVRGADTLERFARDFRDFLSDPFRDPV